VAVVSLGAAHGDPVGVGAEDIADGAGLGDVVERRRGTVGVDVVHRFRRHPTFPQGHAYRPCRLGAVGARRRHVEGVIGQAVADDLQVDRGATRQGPLPLLEHQHPRPLAHHEAVPLPVEGTAGRRGILVPHRHRLDMAKARKVRGERRSLPRRASRRPRCAGWRGTLPDGNGTGRAAHSVVMLARRSG
jgi:hypothetical protein